MGDFVYLPMRPVLVLGEEKVLIDSGENVFVVGFRDDGEPLFIGLGHRFTEGPLTLAEIRKSRGEGDLQPTYTSPIQATGVGFDPIEIIAALEELDNNQVRQEAGGGARGAALDIQIERPTPGQIAANRAAKREAAALRRTFEENTSIEGRRRQRLVVRRQQGQAVRMTKSASASTP